MNKIDTLAEEENGTRRMRYLAGALLLGGAMLLFTACSNGTDNKSDKAPATVTGSGAKTVAGSAATARPAPDAAAGKLVYERHCHFCHGNKGLGNGPVGIAISPHPADFVHDRKRMKQTDEELFKSISEGVTREVGGEAMNMPSWKGILSEAERWDVLAYVRQLEREGIAADEEAAKQKR